MPVGSPLNALQARHVRHAKANLSIGLDEIQCSVWLQPVGLLNSILDLFCTK